MKNPLIQAVQLAYKSGYTYLLKDININICQKQHWLIFGNNGSGKTTLLSMLAGFLRPSSGELLFQGKPYSTDNIEQIHQTMGYVSSSFFDKCFTHETALEIILSGIYGGFSVPFDVAAKDVRKAKYLLQQFGLTNKMDFPYDLLSNGQRQCILIARALMSKPTVLLLDEPTAGLDIIFRSKIIATIEYLCRHTDLTVILVTHHTDEISLCFENSVFLYNGTIFAQGCTEQLFSEDILTKYFNTPLKFYWNQEHASIQIASTPFELQNIL